MRFQFNEKEYKLRFAPTTDKKGRENGMVVLLVDADNNQIGVGCAKKHREDHNNRVMGRIVALRNLTENIKSKTSKAFRGYMWQWIVASGLRFPTK